MKKVYKIILVLFIIDYLCFYIMNELDIHIQSWLGNTIGTLLFLMPLLVLLYLLKKDEDISKEYRIIAKIIFWFMIICLLGGGIGEVIALNN